MNPDELKLSTVNKLFEYEKISRELDTCTNIDLLRNICKCYVKLHMKQQESIAEMGNIFLDLNN
jgi:hypothetical protein